MAAKPILALFSISAALAISTAALADDLSPPPQNLPSLALNPPPPPTKSIWTGFYAGTEIFAFSGGHGGGHFGGDVDIGYNHEFANNIVLGVDASVGFVPYSFGHGALRGYDFAATNLKVGYDMGRFMPFVTTGVVLAKPSTQPGATFTSASDSLNDLFSSPGSVKALGTVGAGFNYALTDHFHVGVAVSVSQGNGLLAPAPAGF